MKRHDHKVGDNRNPIWQRVRKSHAFRPVAFFLFGYLLLAQVLSLFGIAGGLAGEADFKQLYAAGYMVRTGHAREIFNYQATARYEHELVGQVGAILPYNHPSYEALLLAPFSIFSYKVAYLLFFCGNTLVMFLVFLLLRAYLTGYAELWKPLIYAPFLCFFPVQVALVQGQDSIFLLATIVCAFRLEESKRDFWAGFTLAFGLFKFQFVFPIALLFLLWKRWRLVSGFASGAIIWGAVSLAVTGLDSWRTYGSYLLSMSANLTPNGSEMYGILPERMANLRGVVSGTVGALAPRLVVQATVAIASLLLILWAARKSCSFALAALVAFLVSYHAYPHDQVVIVLALALAAITARTASGLQLASCAFVIATPTVAMLTGMPFWLVGIPILVFTYETGRCAASGGHESLSDQASCSTPLGTQA
jgi:hypothetical protein